MGADIKLLRSRIKSVDSTLHLTKAMGLVASSKMRRAMKDMNNLREYQSSAESIMNTLTLCPECNKSPYMQVYEKGKTKIIIIAGDKGMAGGYNSNIFREARAFRNAEKITVGKKASERYKGEMLLCEKFTYEDAKRLAAELCRDYSTGQYEGIYILGTKYISMMTQEPVVKRLFPIEKNGEGKSTDIIFEPSADEIMPMAVEEYITSVILRFVKESFASETASRRTAMDSAGKNAQTMIDSLMLEYNTARQGAITQEITEIVAGSGTETI